MHPAPRRQYVVTLTGEVEYETGDGTRRRFRPGSVFLAEGVSEHGVNVLPAGLVEVNRIGSGPTTPSVIPSQVQPAVEGLSEMRPSAPLPIPPREAT